MMTKSVAALAAAAAIAASAVLIGARSRAVPDAVVPDADPASAPRVFLSEDQSSRATLAGLLPPHTRSVLNIRKRLRHGEFVWDDRRVPVGTIAIRVDLDQQLISVFRSGHEIGSAVVTFGARGLNTPAGTFAVLAKMRQHRSSTYDASMPYTLRLTNDGVSIHGSDVRWGTATHGCIGLPNEFARRLFDQVQVGQPVEVRSDAPA
jgi:hypothetical protein